MLAFAVGIAVGTFATWRRWPGGSLLCGVVASATVALITGDSLPPIPELRFIAFVLVGTGLGGALTTDRRVWSGRLGIAAVLVTIMTVGTGLLAGVLVAAWSDLGPVTALLALAPASAAEMSAAAMALGGDVPLVAASHTVRQITIIVVLQWIVRFLANRSKRNRANGE